MLGTFSGRRVLKTFAGLAIGIASISTVNCLTTSHEALASLNSSKPQNTNQFISKDKINSENLLLAQVPSVTRQINGVAVTAQPLYRYYNPSIVNHFYTVNFSELGSGRDGYISEGIAAYISTQQYPGTIALYRAYNASATDHFYTTNLSELVASGALGYAYEGVAGYVYSIPVTDTVPLYRYYSSRGTDHFYTTNFAELGGGKDGYVFEGITGYVIPY
jgi:hypothetical protein